jgi:hypothetical protein
MDETIGFENTFITFINIILKGVFFFPSVTVMWERFDYAKGAIINCKIQESTIQWPKEK